MRMESIPSPVPLVLFNMCRQPTTWATGALDAFRAEVSAAASAEGRGELQLEGVSLSTAALSVYRGSSSYKCAQEEAFEGSAQTVPLPPTLLYTGIAYVPFLTLPSYVVGGEVRMRMLHGDAVVFNVTTSLLLHRFQARSDVHWLQSSHSADTVTKVYNPSLPPAPVHAHGVREEECRFMSGCSYRMRAGMQSLILTDAAFELPVPSIDEGQGEGQGAAAGPADEATRAALAALGEGHATRPRSEEEANAAASAEMLDEAAVDAASEAAAAAALERAEKAAAASPSPAPAAQSESDVQAALAGVGVGSLSFARRFRRDESMLLFATNLTLHVDYALVIESNTLAERVAAHSPREDEAYDYAREDDEGEGEADADAGPRPAGPTKFIPPDLLLSFHQYELSPMQHVGVAYIIRGTALLLAAAAIAFVKYTNDAERSKHKQR